LANGHCANAIVSSNRLEADLTNHGGRGRSDRDDWIDRNGRAKRLRLQISVVFDVGLFIGGGVLVFIWWIDRLFFFFFAFNYRYGLLDDIMAWDR
jgi:hypothetical protein